MKKFFLSVSVVAAFVLYSFIRQNTVPATAPTSPITDAAPTPEPTSPPIPSPTQGSKTTLPVFPNATAMPTAPPPTPTTAVKRGQYRDGSYIGDTFDAFYGNIQVQAVVSGGRLTDVKILQYPNDRRTSVAINSQALPMLQQEAIQAQSANVDIISGASDTSSAFVQSLGTALKKAV